MLTTIIYRSHICDNVSFKSIEAMVARANERNGQADVTGILLFNGTQSPPAELPRDRVRVNQTVPSRPYQNDGTAHNRKATPPDYSGEDPGRYADKYPEPFLQAPQ